MVRWGPHKMEEHGSSVPTHQLESSVSPESDFVLVKETLVVLNHRDAGVYLSLQHSLPSLARYYPPAIPTPSFPPDKVPILFVVRSLLGHRLRVSDCLSSPRRVSHELISADNNGFPCLARGWLRLGHVILFWARG